jgi:hypothetical protein
MTNQTKPPAHGQIRIQSLAELAAMRGHKLEKVQEVQRSVLQKWIPAELVEAFMALEEPFMEWLRADPKRGFQFVSDPVGAIIDSGLPIDPKVVECLRRALTMQAVASAGANPVDITKMEVVVEPAKR